MTLYFLSKPIFQHLIASFAVRLFPVLPELAALSLTNLDILVIGWASLTLLVPKPTLYRSSSCFTALKNSGSYATLGYLRYISFLPPHADFNPAILYQRILVDFPAPPNKIVDTVEV